MKKKSKKVEQKPKVNPALEGFDIRIDSFGEIKSNFEIDKLNMFLNQHVEDKKLKDRDDLEELKKDDT